MKILVIHGPNMNLVGIQSKNDGKTITLNKINTALRKLATINKIKIKIFQTHSQNKANKFLHSNRNHSSGILLCPQSWNNYGYTIRDTLDLISLPCITIHFNNSNTIFNENKIIDKDYLIAYCRGLEDLIKLISNKNS